MKILHGLSHLVDLAVAHRVLELALKVARHRPELAGVMAESAHQARQLLWPDHDDGDDADDQKFRPTNIEHGFRSRPEFGAWC